MAWTVHPTWSRARQRPAVHYAPVPTSPGWRGSNSFEGPGTATAAKVACRPPASRRPCPSLVEVSLVSCPRPLVSTSFLLPHSAPSAPRVSAVSALPPTPGTSLVPWAFFPKMRAWRCVVYKKQLKSQRRSIAKQKKKKGLWFWGENREKSYVRQNRSFQPFQETRLQCRCSCGIAVVQPPVRGKFRDAS